jgi:HEAT repeat protein
MKPESEKFLAAIQSENADTRYAAWSGAAAQDPEVIPQLGKLLAEAKSPGVRRAAGEALARMVHARRGAIEKPLLALTAPDQPPWTRTMALRHLSSVGGDATVAAVARFLREPAIQEEAVFCLERIPGKASDDALLAALKDVKDDFKPRVLAALGHRKTAAAAEACAALMSSTNLDIAMAAMKAVARIGVKITSNAKAPDPGQLTGTRYFEFADSVLRYADALRDTGQLDEAGKLYKLLLERPEEHLQCAVLISAAKIPSPEALEVIRGKLDSPHRNVRLTAKKLLKA